MPYGVYWGRTLRHTIIFTVFRLACSRWDSPPNWPRTESPAPAGLLLPDAGDDLDRPSAPGDWFACRVSSGAQCRRPAATRSRACRSIEIICSGGQRLRLILTSLLEPDVAKTPSQNLDRISGVRSFALEKARMIDATEQNTVRRNTYVELLNALLILQQLCFNKLQMKTSV